MAGCGSGGGVGIRQARERPRRWTTGWTPSRATISLGVREMACRLNGDGKNFDKAAANLARTAQVQVSGETLRVLVETEGKRVLQAQRSGQLPVGWSAADCQTEQKTTRIYFGSDGVMVPLVTDAEKRSRRQKIKEKRRRRGKKSATAAAAEAGRRPALQGIQDRRLSTTRPRSIGWSRARGAITRRPGG